MFVLKNAWKTIKRNKVRNIMFLIVCIAVSAFTVIGLTVIQTDIDARTTIYHSQRVDTVIKPKTGGLGEGKTAKPLTWEQYSTYAQVLQMSGVQFTVYYYETVPATFHDIHAAGTQSHELQLVGLSDATALKNGPYGSIKLAEGKNPNFSSDNSDDVIISQALAAANKLTIGSKLTTTNPKDTSKTITFHVVGIYESSSTSGATANAVYSSFTAFGTNGFDQTTEPGDQGHELKVVFQLSNPDQFNDFKETVKKGGLNEKQYEVTSPSLQAYNESIKPLHSKAQKTQTALIAALIFGVILALVWLVFALMLRGNELGMALAIGITRIRIGWQLALETLMLTVPGLILGIGLGTCLCPPVIRTAATSIAGIRQTPTPSTLWQVFEFGILTCFAIAMLASFYAALYKTSSLYSSSTLKPLPSDDDDKE